MPDTGTPTAGTLQHLTLDVEAQVRPPPRPNFVSDSLQKAVGNHTNLRRVSGTQLQRFANTQGGIGDAILMCFAILIIGIPTVAACTLLIFFIAIIIGHVILFGLPHWYESPGVYEAGGITGALFFPFPFVLILIDSPTMRTRMKEKSLPWLLHPLTIVIGTFILGFPCAATSGAIVRAIGANASPGRITAAYCLGMPILAAGCGFVVWSWRKYCS